MIVRPLINWVTTWAQSAGNPKELENNMTTLDNDNPGFTAFRFSTFSIGAGCPWWGSSALTERVLVAGYLGRQPANQRRCSA
jgi:hypothetical protein